MNAVKEKKKIGLTTKIFIALIAGAIVGIALNMFAADVDFVQNVLVNGIFYVVGQGFIRLMQMLVVPLVFCSLICGATAIGDSKTLGKVGVKIIGFYIFTTMMAVAVALDNMQNSEILGTIAGDDTVFCVVRTHNQAAVIIEKLYRIIHSA